MMFITFNTPTPPKRQYEGLDVVPDICSLKGNTEEEIGRFCVI